MKSVHLATFRVRASVPAVVALLAACVMTQQAKAQQSTAQTGDDPILPQSRLCLAEQVVYNDNVFLAHRDADVRQSVGSNASRTDTIFKTSACGDGVMRFYDQSVVLSGVVEDNRYMNNDQLNHVAGNGTLQWNWRTLWDFRGELGGKYQRALGSFLYDRPLEKDLVDAERYHFRLQKDIGAHLGFDGGAQRVSTTHSADSRQSDDYRNDGFNAGLVLTSRADNFIGASYERNDARYPHDTLIGGVPVDRDYREEKEYLRFNYAFTDKTLIKGTAGALKREYLHPEAGEGYSGSVWRGDFRWKPRERIAFGLSGWRELSAYFDSEADHFISTGGGISSSWSPRDKWNLSANWRMARQRYITQSLAQTDNTQRRDDVQTGTFSTQYRTDKYFIFELRVQYEDRDSSLDVYSYDNVITSLQVTGQM